jgi:hypothetical protein
VAQFAAVKVVAAGDAPGDADADGEAEAEADAEAAAPGAAEDEGAADAFGDAEALGDADALVRGLADGLAEALAWAPGGRQIKVSCPYLAKTASLIVAGWFAPNRLAAS